MLYSQNTTRHGFRRVVLINLHNFLRDNGPGIVMLVDKVNRRTRNACSTGNNRFVDVLTIHAPSAKSWEQSRMDIDDPVGIRFKRAGAQLFHVASEDDKVSLMCLKTLLNCTVEIDWIWMCPRT